LIIGAVALRLWLQDVFQQAAAIIPELTGKK